MSTDKTLLDGIRVVDLTRVLAGPYCTMMLGDLGADVIKIEVPERGDDTRHWGPPFTDGGQSAYFISTNRNKRSITLNLKSPDGLSALKDLIRWGDVLIENFRTGTLEKLGLDYVSIKKIRPDIIYCTITGYGYTGPYKDRPGYDFMAQALGGLMSITGPEGGEPVRVGVAAVDLVTGIFASNAIIASLFARERTGEGQRIDMSLLDSQVAFLSYAASNYLVSGQKPKRMGNAHPNIVPYQSFKTKDKYIAFAAANDIQWKKFCLAVNHHEWVTDERYATNQDRVKNREQLIPLLDKLFSERTANAWIDLCIEIGVPAAPINTIDEVFADPQVIERERVIRVDHNDDQAIPLIASPMNILAAPASIRYPPPSLGEHTEEVLHELLGYSNEKINDLRASGAI